MLPDPIVCHRLYGVPLVRPWMPVAISARRFHWVDPHEGEHGFICPNREDATIARLQDVLVWDPETRTWDAHGLVPCGRCLPSGIDVTSEPPAFRALIFAVDPHAWKAAQARKAITKAARVL